MNDKDNQQAAIAHDRQQRGEPSGYAYRHRDYDGVSTVIRFNNGGDINGSRPLEALPYWFAPQPAAPAVKDSLTIAAQPSVLNGCPECGITHERSACLAAPPADGHSLTPIMDACERDVKAYWRAIESGKLVFTAEELAMAQKVIDAQKLVDGQSITRNRAMVENQGLAEKQHAKTTRVFSIDLKNAHTLADFVNSASPDTGPIDALHKSIDRLAAYAQPAPAMAGDESQAQFDPVAEVVIHDGESTIVWNIEDNDQYPAGTVLYVAASPFPVSIGWMNEFKDLANELSIASLEAGCNGQFDGTNKITLALDGLLDHVSKRVQPASGDDARDAVRYRVLRDDSYQMREDDPCVTDDSFNTFFGEDLDKVVDALKSRHDAAMQQEGQI